MFEETATKLAQKKRGSAATVIVLESLSQALPDDTYLTELHVADGKVEITGVTREAASLIQIIEQTDQFRTPHSSAHHAGPAGGRRTVPYRSPDRALLSGLAMSAAADAQPPPAADGWRC